MALEKSSTFDEQKNRHQVIKMKIKTRVQRLVLVWGVLASKHPQRAEPESQKTQVQGQAQLMVSLVSTSPEVTGPQMKVKKGLHLS